MLHLVSNVKNESHYRKLWFFKLYNGASFNRSNYPSGTNGSNVFLLISLFRFCLRWLHLCGDEIQLEIV